MCNPGRALPESRRGGGVRWALSGLGRVGGAGVRPGASDGHVTTRRWRVGSRVSVGVKVPPECSPSER